MSNDKDTSEKKLFANVAGAGAGMVVVNKLHRDRFIRNVMNEDSHLHEGYHLSKDYLESRKEDLDPIDRLIKETNGEKPRSQTTLKRAQGEVERFEHIMTEVEGIKASPKYQEGLKKFHASPKYRTFSESVEALDIVRNNPREIEAVHFLQEKGKPVTEIVLAPAKQMHFDIDAGGLVEKAAGPARRLKIPGIGAHESLQTELHEGVKKLYPHEIDTLGKSKWFDEAEALLKKTEKSFETGAKARIFKSSAPSGWISKHAGGPGLMNMITGAVLGAVVVGGVASLFIGGKGSHAQREAARQQYQGPLNQR